jgi:hypothetical protein
MLVLLHVPEFLFFFFLLFIDLIPDLNRLLQSSLCSTCIVLHFFEKKLYNSRYEENYSPTITITTRLRWKRGNDVIFFKNCVTVIRSEATTFIV